ncbi:hypothetical protein [Bradyrhizobium liaoningense]
MRQVNALPAKCALSQNNVAFASIDDLSRAPGSFDADVLTLTKINPVAAHSSKLACKIALAAAAKQRT